MNNSQSNYDDNQKQMETGTYRFIFCSQCGKRLDSNDKFCSGCGSQIEKNQPNNYAERKQEYAGKLIKCPNCGEILNSFVTKCPTCGYELRGAKANSSIKELLEKLEAIDLQPDDSINETFREDSDLKREEYRQQYILTKKEKQKITLIRNFPIPNTREDLYEFLILAASNVDTEYVKDSDQSKGEKALSMAWKAKYEQAYHKAYISFGDSHEFEELNKRYLAKMQEYEDKKDKDKKGHRKSFVFEILISIILWSLFAMYISNDQKIVEAENRRLELILENIQEYMEEGEYDKARALTTTLVFNVSSRRTSAEEAEEHWDNVRQELYEVIENAENKNSETLRE